MRPSAERRAEELEVRAAALDELLDVGALDGFEVERRLEELARRLEERT